MCYCICSLLAIPWSHCIGVDPYDLTYKAEMLGYHPQVILAGSPIKGAKVNVLGITFKENVPDLRNSKVADLIAECAV